MAKTHKENGPDGPLKKLKKPLRKPKIKKKEQPKIKKKENDIFYMYNQWAKKLPDLKINNTFKSGISLK